jgi:hypothetical protein
MNQVLVAHLGSKIVLKPMFFIIKFYLKYSYRPYIWNITPISFTNDSPVTMNTKPITKLIVPFGFFE